MAKKNENKSLTKEELKLYDEASSHYLKEDTTLLIKIIETDDVELIYKITKQQIHKHQ